MVYGNYPDLSNVKKILLVKLRHLGDVLLITPCIRVLREKFPDAEIDCYLYEEAKEILRGHPDLSRIITYDQKWKKLSWYKKIFHEFSILKRIKKEKYDLVLNLTEGDRGAIATKASKAPVKVGWDPGDKGVWKKKKIYTHIVKHAPQEKHEVEKNLDSLRKIGIYPELHSRELFFPLGEGKESIEKTLKNHRIEKNDYIVIHPTSRWRFKCLPPSTMKKVTESLLEMGEKVIICSGPDPLEKEMVQKIIGTISHPSLFDFSGSFTIQELGACIFFSKLLLCVDSVSAHIASALKSRMIVFFGPTSEKKWGPWRNSNAHVFTQKNYLCRPCFSDGCGGSKMSDCLMTIPPEKIISKITEMLDQGVNSLPK